MKFRAWTWLARSVFLFSREKKKKKSRVRSQCAYWRLRRSRYSDAASADSATTAIPLNSGIGMFDCGRLTLLPEPGEEDCPLVTLILPNGVAL